MDTVTAPGEMWLALNEKNNKFNTFRRQGYRNYKLLTELYGTTTATRALRHSSASSPPTSDEERQMENESLTPEIIRGEMEVSEAEGDSDEIERVEVNVQPSVPLGRHQERTPDAQDKLKYCIDILESSTSLRPTPPDSKRSRSLLSPEKKDEFSTASIMDELNAMTELSDQEYLICVDRIVDPNWRLVFMKMPPGRRKAWLARELHK
ncbi:hypothetical protein CRG98_029033 [Punica granatum]|uniref:Uncharacterized protein n=1 Tax=Punica granatum TaxID=22663 RepID=A0A2I0J3G2_PUNGR|nr:hypothetical protein CRG98_029033 [Punica granatum]